MNLSEAAAEAAKFGQTIRAFQKLSEVAQTLLGLEQNISEREALAKSLVEDTERVRADLLAAKGAIESAKQQAADILRSAQESATAEREATRRDVDALKADAQTAVAVLEEKRDSLVAECNQVVAKRDDARKELAHVNEKIEAAREAARKAFG